MAAAPWSPLVALAGQKQVLLYNTDNLQIADLTLRGRFYRILKF